MQLDSKKNRIDYKKIYLREQRKNLQIKVQITTRLRLLQYKIENTQRRYATEQQFTRYAQTGDVILFRDNHTMAKVQRFLTNSECDHIGLVFKD